MRISPHSINEWFLFKNNIMFTMSGSMRLRFLEIMSPVVEKTLSAATEVPWTHRWGIAYFWTIGNWCACSFYQLRGSASILQDGRLLNLSISASTLALLVCWMEWVAWNCGSRLDNRLGWEVSVVSANCMSSVSGSSAANTATIESVTLLYSCSRSLDERWSSDFILGSAKLHLFNTSVSLTEILQKTPSKGDTLIYLKHRILMKYQWWNLVEFNFKAHAALLWYKI